VKLPAGICGVKGFDKEPSDKDGHEKIKGFDYLV
jgi:hypothetical protein